MNTIVISGRVARILPYSESRRKKLLAVAEEIEAYLNSLPPEASVEQEKRAEFWRRKAEVLLDFATHSGGEQPGIEFFASDEFESGLLADVEQDFIRRRLYL